jgi:glycosyltransferase 2 family protein
VKPGRSIWNVGWRAIVGVLLLAWIFHAIFLTEARRIAPTPGYQWEQLTRTEQWTLAWWRGPQELWRTLNLVEPGALLISLVFMGMTIVLGLLRWRMVLRMQGLNLSLVRTTEISFVAHFFNSFLLGSTGGDLLKAYYAARETHHKKTEAVVTVLADRLIGLFAMLLFACLMMGPNHKLLGEHRRLAALSWLVFLMMGGCGSLLAVSFWGGVSKRWSNARHWLRRLPKAQLLERALDASRQFGRERVILLKLLGISMILNVFCVLQIMTLARGLHLAIPPVALFVIVPIVVCISALPITPSGLGLRENLYVLMLSAPEIHVDPTRALSLSLLAYAGSLFWSIVGGLVYLSRRDRDHLAEIATPADVTEEVGSK